MLCRYSKRSAGKSDSRKQPGSIKVQSLSHATSICGYEHGVTLDFSRPGKPTDNAFIESSNGKFRAECLNAHWFMSLDDVTKMRGFGVETTTRRDLTPRSATKVPMELIDRSVACGLR